MKRVIICLLSIVAWSNSINVAAQDNGYTMLKDSTVWCYVNEYVTYDVFDYYNYIAIGDTVVDNKTYKKIYSFSNDFHKSNAIYKGGMREVGQRVFAAGKWGSSLYELDQIDGETLLYDFSLQIDESFGKSIKTGKPCVVDYLELVEFPDGKRKYYQLTGDPLHGGWLEGVGSMAYNPFTPFYINTTSMERFYLFAFIQNGKSLYNLPDFIFVKNGTHWIERKTLENGIDYTLIDYYIKEDTIIDEKSYSKVYANNKYQGAIRMNIERKIFYLKENAKQESKLYDFHWIPGKEIHSVNYQATDFILIDSEGMSGKYFNQKMTLNDGKEYDYRILDSNPNPEGIPFHTLSKEVRLIKDIGLTSGIFSHVEVSKENARTYNDLVSVYDGDKLIYLNPAFKENGELETSISTVAAELHLQVTVSNGEAVFTLQEGPKMANTLLQIYSVDGRLVTTRSLNSGTATVGNLPQGVYYYRTESGQGMPANGKFLME